MAGILNQIKVATGIQQEESSNLLSQVDEWITLTWKQRFIGFGICVGLGIFLTLLSLPLLWFGNITGFAICYSFGSVVSLASTCFLMGPVSQVKRMFDEHRIIATIVMLLAIVATLVIAFKTHNALLCLIFIFIQFLALCWYAITYIPGGQTAVKALIFRGAV